MPGSTYQFQGTYEPKVAEVLATVAFGATGAPTLSSTHAKGVKSITRSAAGKYVFVFGKDASLFGDGIYVFSALLGVQATFEEDAAGGPAAPIVSVVSKDLSAGSVTVQCWSYDGDGALEIADPGDGETGYFRFTFSGQ